MNLRIGIHNEEMVLTYYSATVGRLIKQLGKIFLTKNRDCQNKFHFELQEFEVRICVQPNSPIIILILLTAFHKFAMSMGAKPCTERFSFVLREFQLRFGGSKP